MSNEPTEIPDEPVADAFAAWRRCLQQPDAVPGYGLADRDAAWEKLHRRLSRAPRRRRYAYRIAAACILVLLVPSARLLWPGHRVPAPGSLPTAASSAGKTVRALPPPAAGAASATTGTATQAGPASPATAETATPAPSPAAAPATPASTLSATGSSARLTAARSLAATAPRVLRGWPRPVRPVMTRPGSLLAAGTVPGGSAAITIPSPGLPATPPPVTARPAPKKEWKVVDLNELDPGRQRAHGMAAGRQPTFRIGLGIDEAETAPAREEDDRLRIPLPTQNH